MIPLHQNLWGKPEEYVLYIKFDKILQVTKVQ